MPIFRAAKPNPSIPKVTGNVSLIPGFNIPETKTDHSFPVQYFNHHTKEFEEYEPLNEAEGYYDTDYESEDDEDEGDEEFIEFHRVPPMGRPPCTETPDKCDKHCHCGPCLYCRNYNDAQLRLNLNEMKLNLPPR